MGCIWSNESERGRDWNYQNSQYTARNQRSVRPRFGEFRCICGRTWNSRLSWQNAFQNCKRCRRRVYPHNLRDLRPSNMSKGKENAGDHEKELCQMCQQLGQYCGSKDKSRARY